MADINEAGVRFVIEDLDKYLGGLKDANAATKDVGETAEDAAAKHGRAVDKMQRDATDRYDKIGKAALKMGTVLAGVFVAGIAAALKFAGDFDDALDTIQVGTGATGEELGELQKSFENVFTSIPADGGDIALAMTAINQKTGATGPALETLTAQVVELSRITGTDLNTNVEAVTGVIQRWGLSADAAAPFLDELFRISQESGVPVAELAEGLKTNKAILDQLGLPLKDSARLLGALGKAGIDSDAAFAGLRVALVKMAKDGIKDPAAEMQKYFERIKNAKTDADATAIAVNLFGKQAVGMAGAIRDGSFDLKAFSAAVDGNKNSIEDTARQTDDWKEKLTLLKNQGLVALKPVLMEVFKTAGEVVEAVQPALDAFLKWFQKDIEPPVRDMIRLFENDVAPAIRGLLRLFEIVLAPGVKAVFDTIGDYIKATVDVLTGTIELINALVHGRWDEAWTALQKVAGAAFELVAAYPKMLFRLLDQYFGEGFRALGETLRGWLDTYVLKPFQSVVGFGAAAAQIMRDFAGGIRDGLGALRAWLGDNIATYVLNPIATLAGFAAAGLGLIGDFAGAVKGALDGLRGWLGDNIATYILNPIANLVGFVAAGVDLISDLALGIKSSLSILATNVVGWAKNVGGAIFSGAVSGLGDLGGALVDWVSDAVAAAVAAVTSAANGAIGKLESGVNSVIYAINRALEFSVGLDTPFGEINISVNPPDIPRVYLPRIGSTSGAAPSGTPGGATTAAARQAGGGMAPGVDAGLSAAVASLATAVSSLAGSMARPASPALTGGGVTYQVSAVYTNPQSPQSILLDLEAIAMMASA